jgi:hypothetical protein
VIVATYRFYLLDRGDNITTVHFVECEGVGDIQHATLSLLAEHEVAAAVEVWERDKIVSRTERAKYVPVAA